MRYFYYGVCCHCYGDDILCPHFYDFDVDLVGHKVSVCCAIQYDICKTDPKYCPKFKVSSTLNENWFGISGRTWHI